MNSVNHGGDNFQFPAQHDIAVLHQPILSGGSGATLAVYFSSLDDHQYLTASTIKPIHVLSDTPTPINLSERNSHR